MFDEKTALELDEKGYNYMQIASILNCSYSTVANRIRRKSKIKSRRSCSLLHSKFGARVSEILVDRDISITKFSKLTGIHSCVLSRILTGSQDVRLSEIMRIAKCLDLDIFYFLK